MTKEAPWQPANAPSLLAETVGNVLYQNPKKINFKSKFLRFFCSLQLISRIIHRCWRTTDTPCFEPSGRALSGRAPWASAHKREKPGRYESRGTDTLRCQRGGTWQVNHCDLALKTFKVRLPAGQ